MATLLIYTFSCLCLYLILIIVRFFNKLWLSPIRIQSQMRAQGIRGPSYKFLYGNTKEMMKMTTAAKNTPSELSHHTFPRIQPHFYSWDKIYGKNFLVWHGLQAQLVVTELELIKEILNNKDGNFTKTEVSGLVRGLLGDGLVTSTGEKWTKMRKLANHAFHAESLKSMTPAMIASVEMMLERWRKHDGKEIEVFQEFKVLTSEIISRTAFGGSYLEGQHIFDMLTKMVLIIFRSQYKVRIPGIGRILKPEDDIASEKLEQEIRDSILKMIKKREEDAMLNKQDSYGSDFLGQLVKALHDADQSKRITIDDLIDECKTFYVAGQETSTCLLSWTILLLAIYQDWQDKARQEILELFGKENPTSDGISRLKTMSMIVNESLRLYSPAVIITRKVAKEVKLGEMVLPANMEITISTLAIHHNPEIWGKDVHLFKPERFADGVAEATKENPVAFFPFGLGLRTCVGSNFAIIESKIALCMILQHFRFTLSPNYVHSPTQLLTMCPQKGLQVILHRL